MQTDNTILIVEDDKFIALALKIRLQAEKYQVTVANSCKEAWEVVGECVPDIALVDFNLPDGNGIDFISSLMKNPRSSSVSAIVMTASKKSGLSQKAMAQGAVGYFEKPFKSEEFLAAIRSQSFNSNSQVVM